MSRRGGGGGGGGGQRHISDALCRVLSSLDFFHFCHDCWLWPIDYMIRWLVFGRFLSWPWPWIFKVEYGICFRPKMVRLPWNKKQTHQLNSRPHIWPLGLILAMILTLNFQGQIWSLLYLNQKWSDCHETKSKHMDGTPGLKCDQWVWPRPWPWHLNFQGQMWSWPISDQGQVQGFTR